MASSAVAELLVVTLVEVVPTSLRLAEQRGTVYLAFDQREGRAALYLNSKATDAERVGYVKSHQVAEHLRSGRQAYARLNESLCEPFSITCTLIC